MSSVNSVLIEVDDQFDEQRENVNRILKNAGMDLKEKRQFVDYDLYSQTEMFEHRARFGNTFNL